MRCRRRPCRPGRRATRGTTRGSSAIVAMLTLLVAGVARGQEEAPAAPARDDAAVLALEEVVAAYRELPGVKVESKLTISLAEDDVTSTGETVETTLVRHADGTGVLELRGFTIVLEDGLFSATHESNPDDYFQTKTPAGYPYWNIFSAFGGFERMPFPHLAILWGSDRTDDMLMELYADTPELVPTKVSEEEGEGGPARVITLESANAKMTLRVNPTTNLIDSIEHEIRGGLFVPEGTVRTNRYEVEVTPLEAGAKDERVPFDAGGREPVDLFAALIRQPEAPPVMARGPEAGLVGQEAPNFQLTTLDGERIDLRALRGQVVVLDFWATWCGPCVKALPEVEKVAAWARAEALPVTVLAINTFERIPSAQRERRIEAVKSFLQEQGLDLSVPLDLDDAVALRYGVTGIPTTVVIDPNGVIHTLSAGLHPEHATWLKAQVSAAMGSES